jgi:hypothetical protein
LGYVGYYRRFIENILCIFRPLFYLLNKHTEFVWIETCHHVLDELEVKLSKNLVLRGPNWTLHFQISTYASDTDIRSILEKLEGKYQYEIYYVSKNISAGELNYMVTDKEFHVFIHAINKFRHYITRYCVILHTNHVVIKYLMNKQITNGKVTRWFLYCKNLILPF